LATVNQAVVALEDSPIANATTLAELQEAKLGAQVGTTSLDFITEDIQPTQQPMVYNDTNDAKSALEAGQIDGIVVDLPTAYYVTAVEFDNAKIVGQFPAQEGGEEFGLLMAKGSPLVTCVNQALTWAGAWRPRAASSSARLAPAMKVITRYWLPSAVMK